MKSNLATKTKLGDKALDETGPRIGSHRVRGEAPSKLDIIDRMLGLGFAIFPVREGEKTPAIAGGHNSASKDKAIVNGWFRANPNLNYGIATGAGTFVLDIDGEQGLSNLQKLWAEQADGRVPFMNTMKVETPHGRHYYFRSSANHIGNSVGKIAEGIDIRGDGGYAVGPGSRLPDGDYRLAPGRRFDVIAPAPAWLLRMVGQMTAPELNETAAPLAIADDNLDRARAYAAAAFRQELNRLRKAPVRQRNNTLNICAFKCGQFVARGLLEAAKVQNELTRIARDVGLGQGEISATITAV
jgi:putative DNA primase/helicase